MSQIKAPKGATHKAVNGVGNVMYWLNSKIGQVFHPNGENLTISDRYKGPSGVKALAEAADCKVIPHAFQLENK